MSIIEYNRRWPRPAKADVNRPLLLCGKDFLPCEKHTWSRPRIPHRLGLEAALASVALDVDYGIDSRVVKTLQRRPEEEKVLQHLGNFHFSHSAVAISFSGRAAA